MEHSITITVNGLQIVVADDTDEMTIAAVFRHLATLAESIERFGLKNTLRCLEKDEKLRIILFQEAQAGSGFASTVVTG